MGNHTERRVLRLFLGGDYNFLCENFGHPGAASTSFCIWCPVTLNDKRADTFEDRGWGEDHTLETLLDSCGGNPVFRFQLDRMVVLPLHLTWIDFQLPLDVGKASKIFKGALKTQRKKELTVSFE